MPTYTYGTSVAVLGHPAGVAPAVTITTGPQHPTAASVVGSGDVWIDADATTYTQHTWSDTKEPVGGTIDEAWWQGALAQVTVPDMPADATIYGVDLSGSAEVTIGEYLGSEGSGVAVFLTDSSAAPYINGGFDVAFSFSGDGSVLAAASFTTFFEADPAATPALLDGDIYLLAIGEAATGPWDDTSFHYPTYSTVRVYEITLAFNWYTTDDVARRPHCRVHPRDDNRGPSRRLFPLPTSAQTPGRITGYQ